MTQPTVPWWFATAVVVLGSADAAALTYQDPNFVLPPVIRFGLFIGNVVFLSLAAVLNIKKSTS